MTLISGNYQFKNLLPLTLWSCGGCFNYRRMGLRGIPDSLVDGLHATIEGTIQEAHSNAEKYGQRTWTVTTADLQPLHIGSKVEVIVENPLSDLSFDKQDVIDFLFWLTAMNLSNVRNPISFFTIDGGVFLIDRIDIRQTYEIQGNVFYFNFMQQPMMGNRRCSAAFLSRLMFRLIKSIDISTQISTLMLAPHPEARKLFPLLLPREANLLVTFLRGSLRDNGVDQIDFIRRLNVARIIESYGQCINIEDCLGDIVVRDRKPKN